MRYNGCTVFMYMNNWLLMGSSSQAAWLATLLLHLLRSLGICVNKEILTLTVTIDFMGATLETSSGEAYLPIDRVQAVNGLINQVTLLSLATIRICLSLLGCMVTCTCVTSFVRLHLCCLWAWLQSVYTLDKDNMNDRVTVPPKVRASLIWWMKPDEL